jgi:arylsulfatase A-like enzyme
MKKVTILPAPSPNILLILTDDQRHDTIGALGCREAKTPHQDALVARGMAFTQGHIPGGTVPAVCCPSRAMLYSGRSLFRIHDSGRTVPAAHVMLGEHLRSHGYRSFGCGKWHNGREAFSRSFDAGNEIFFGGMADHWNVPSYRFDPTGSYAGRLPYAKNYEFSTQLGEREGDHITAGSHSTDLIADAATEFINHHDGKSPFFAAVNFLAPHDPRTMPEEFRKQFMPDNMILPPNFLGGHPIDTGALTIRDEMLAAFPRRPEEILRHVAEYHAMIAHLDAGIGRILAALDARGWRNDTIVVLCGDNGLALGQHGLMGKQSCYEHSVRVPLVLAGPGVPAGQRSASYAYLFDIFPTLCDLTQLPTPTSVEGCSLRPVLRNPGASVRDELYLAYGSYQRAIKTRRHKLIEFAVEGRRIGTRLFDLEADPWEMHDLTDVQPELADRLRKALRHMATQWGDEDTPQGKAFWSAWGNPAF